MDVTLETLTSLTEAFELAPEIDRHAAESTAEFRDETLPDDVGKRLLVRHFDEPQCVVIVARSEGQRIGMCVTAPFVDPLVGDSMPMVVVLSVHPEFRHRGLAAHLVKATQRELESRGIKVLAARAGHNDDALISMGERWGFVRTWEMMVHE